MGRSTALKIGIGAPLTGRGADHTRGKLRLPFSSRLRIAAPSP